MSSQCFEKRSWVDSHSYCCCTKLPTELSDISRKWAGLPRGRISANYLLLVFTFTHCLWPGFLERRCILGAFANWESVSGPSIRHQPWPEYGHHTHCGQCHHTGSKQEIPCPSPSAVITNVFQSIRVWSKKNSFFLSSFWKFPLFYAPTADVINPMQFCVQHRLCEYPKECLLLGDSNRFDLTFFSGQNIGIGNGNGGGHVPLSGQWIFEPCLNFGGKVFNIF